MTENVIDLCDIIESYLTELGFVEVPIDDLINDTEVIPHERYSVIVKSNDAYLSPGIYGWDKSFGLDSHFKIDIIDRTKIKVTTGCLATSNPFIIDLCDPESLDDLRSLIINE